MATAVKNAPETSASSLFDRAAAVSLVGVVYVVGCFGIVFKLLPYLFWDVLQIPENNATNIIVAVLIVAIATVLLIVGVRLLGNRAPHGARAGIFVGVIGVVLILLLTRWASLWIEYGAYNENWYSPTVGAALTAGFGLALLLVGGFYFLHPKFERYLTQFEDQGWFSVTAFKPLQGVRVRRATVFGLVLLVGAGLYTLYSRGTLARLPQNWELNLPFTGKTTVNLVDLFGSDQRVLNEMSDLPRTASPADRQKRLAEAVTKFVKENAGAKEPLDANAFLASRLAETFDVTGATFTTTRYALRDYDHDLANYVTIDDPKDSEFDPLKVMPKSEVDRVSKELLANNRMPPKTAPLPPVYGTDTYATLQLLPLVQYTVLFMLAALSLWMAWRIVNYPAFADFLIATEAEMNKVSWTSRKNLIKDTIVVLVTVFLLAGYLFAMDQAWSHILSWKPVRILQIPQDDANASKADENKPW